VNGGLNGWARFLEYVQGLSKLIAVANVATSTQASAEQNPADPNPKPGTIGDVKV